MFIALVWHASTVCHILQKPIICLVPSEPITQSVTRRTLDKPIQTPWGTSVQKFKTGAPFLKENLGFCTRPKLFWLISLGGPWWKFGRLGCQRLPGPVSHQAINYAWGGRGGRDHCWIEIWHLFQISCLQKAFCRSQRTHCTLYSSHQCTAQKMVEHRGILKQKSMTVSFQDSHPAFNPRLRMPR